MLYIGSDVSYKCRETLKKLNIPFEVMPQNASLPSPVCTHPDMSAVTIQGRLFSAGDMARFFAAVDTGETFGDRYPYDVIFNGFEIGGNLVCNENSFSKAVLQFATDNGMRVINVNQGYAKCSTLVLGNKGVITADRSIAKALEGVCKVLLIEAGGILLPPYNFGFIGGASFIIGKTVYFFGNICNHRNCDMILNFISECGFNAISLSDEPLFDCGGGIYTDE
ncbi:MAG: hypothetical protein IKU61_02530 [Clostridia bacterium]|nr:hypothetical protein [Clostridia bacterium]